MVYDLSREENLYLAQRGFHVVEGIPTHTEQAPYITLGDHINPDHHLPITLHESPICQRDIGGDPETIPPNELAGRVRKLAAVNRVRTEGPLKVFVTSPEWQETANHLASPQLI